MRFDRSITLKPGGLGVARDLAPKMAECANKFWVMTWVKILNLWCV